MKVLFLIIAAAVSVFPQDADPNTRNVKAEIKPVYKEWLDKDVFVLITIDPRDAYFKLETDEERDKFVEDYLTKREADPDKALGNARYERTAHAEEHFTDRGIGSRTDRGRIYILWGKPDGIERGRMRIAGSDADVPFEKWLCEGREFIFIDPAVTGDYRLIMAEEKKPK